MKRLHGGAKDPSLLDFSANVNFLGPPDSVRALLAGAADHVDRYPSADAAPLREALARHHGIPADCILAGNGASELIYLAAALYRGRRGRVVTPAFTEYEDACDAYGIALGAAAPELTFVGNPGSPGGRLLPRKEILALPGILIVDEAFIDFAGGRESLIDAAAADPRIIVLRSLTKFYALPGLRIGFAVAVPETIRALKLLQPPWSVNQLAQLAGIAAIRDAAYAERTLRELAPAREELRKGLSTLGFDPSPSETNYVLCRVPDAAALQEALLARGIAVRNCDSFTGLDPNRFVRIAVRAPAENRRLLSALAGIGSRP
jgi:threonine-phosphate decarboxylase